jgi:hypothetical protein
VTGETRSRDALATLFCPNMTRARPGLACGGSPDQETTQLYEAIQQRRDLPSPVGRQALPASTASRQQERYRLEAELGWGGMGVVYCANPNAITVAQ